MLGKGIFQYIMRIIHYDIMWHVWPCDIRYFQKINQQCLLHILHPLLVEMGSVLPKMFCYAQRVIKWSVLDAKALHLLAELHYLFYCEFFSFTSASHLRFQLPGQSCLHEDQCTLNLGLKVLHDGLMGRGWVFIDKLNNSRPVMLGEIFTCFLLKTSCR